MEKHGQCLLQGLKQSKMIRDSVAIFVWVWSGSGAGLDWVSREFQVGFFLVVPGFPRKLIESPL